MSFILLILRNERWYHLAGPDLGYAGPYATNFMGPQTQVAATDDDLF